MEVVEKNSDYEEDNAYANPDGIGTGCRIGKTDRRGRTTFVLEDACNIVESEVISRCNTDENETSNHEGFEELNEGKTLAKLQDRRR